MSLDFNQTLNSSLYGVLRGVCVHTIIYPLGVIKIHQQSQDESEIWLRIANRIFKQEGTKAFYKGLHPQLLRTSLNSLWVWPVLTQTPLFLQRFHFAEIPQQVLTGLFIATIDACVTTPLERAKILSAFQGKNTFALSNFLYKEGWRGFSTHWTKLGINWSTFLAAQKYFRNQEPDENPPLSQLVKIGTKTAMVVSVVGAPFDIANTLKQTQNLSPAQLFSRTGIYKWYRGWPLSTASLLVHNVASVYVIDKLENKSGKS